MKLPTVFQFSQQEGRTTFSSPSLKYSLTPHVEVKGGYENYRKKTLVPVVVKILITSFSRLTPETR